MSFKMPQLRIKFLPVFGIKVLEFLLLYYVISGICMILYEPGDFRYPKFSGYALYFVVISIVPISFGWALIFSLILYLFGINKLSAGKIFGLSLGITFLWIGITLIIGRIGRGPIDYTYFKGNTFEIFVVPLLSALIFSVLCRYLLAKERYSYH